MATTENILVYVVFVLVLAMAAGVVYGVVVYRRENAGNLYASLALAAVFTLLASSWGMGVLFKLSIVVMMVWLPYSVIAMIFRPARRWARLARVAIWVGAFSLAGGIHYVRHQAVMKDANEIVAAVVQYTAAHGRCPASLDEIGVSREQLQAKLGHAYYKCSYETPSLSIADPYDQFDWYTYDFNAKAWVFHPD